MLLCAAPVLRGASDFTYSQEDQVECLSRECHWKMQLWWRTKLFVRCIAVVRQWKKLDTVIIRKSLIPQTKVQASLALQQNSGCSWLGFLFITLNSLIKTNISLVLFDRYSWNNAPFDRSRQNAINCNDGGREKLAQPRKANNAKSKLHHARYSVTLKLSSLHTWIKKKKKKKTINTSSPQKFALSKLLSTCGYHHCSQSGQKNRYQDNITHTCIQKSLVTALP